MVFLRKKGEKYNGLMSCYHLHFDKYLGISKAAVRRIPCSCVFCVQNKSLPWVHNIEANLQPRFQPNKQCLYNKVFGEYNDWIIIDVKPKTIEDDNNMDELRKDVLMGIQDIISNNIKIGQFGVYMIFCSREGNG